ncbi:MAG: hypothetical protein ACJ763_10425 [Bdellovibrionia bacterium]
MDQLRSTRQAFRILQFAVVMFTLLAGIDKYAHVLTNWEQYMSPLFMGILGAKGTHTFFLVDGAIEILVAIGVALRPRIFAYIVSAWLMGIVINLLTTGHFYDVALRDFALSLSAFALGRLAGTFSSRTPAA